jgi:8-oxo-dGTP pyrophosphatase MutT (NUDIX family)
VLLAKRKVKEGEGMYCLPGGKREKGEKPIKAAQREIREELGIDIKTLKQVDVRKKRLSKVWQNVIFFTLLNDRQIKKIKNVEPDKTETIGWFGLNELPENMWEHNRQYLLDNLERITILKNKANAK